MGIIKIGYQRNTYPEQRNIINITKDNEYIKLFNYDIYRIKYIMYKILNKLKIVNGGKLFKYAYSFNDLNLNKVDIIHFFNSISYGNIPWVCTFETAIPRFDKYLNIHKEEKDCFNKYNTKEVEKVLNHLSKDSCKKIIAMSNTAFNIQKSVLQQFPKQKDIILKKMCIIHPPQQLYVNNFYEKDIDIDGCIIFTFVGRDFERKGGVEIIEVFNELQDEYNFKVNIIGKIDSKKNQNIISIIKNNPHWINYYESLPNEEVISIMKKTHIGLLPTYQDTYGYSVLEFQATGCPVITTNVRALPEINNNKTGWIIELEKNSYGESILDLKKINTIIKEQLKNIVREILDNPFMIIEKSNNSIDRIKKYHCPQLYEEKINTIYNEALSHKEF